MGRGRLKGRESLGRKKLKGGKGSRGRAKVSRDKLPTHHSGASVGAATKGSESLGPGPNPTEPTVHPEIHRSKHNPQEGDKRTCGISPARIAKPNDRKKGR